MPSTWDHQGSVLTKEFTFKNFSQALAFVNHVGELSEQVQHHPDIFLHDYKFVRITLTTHDHGGVTQKDVDLVAEIDRFNLS